MSECIEAPDLQEAFTNASAEEQAARAQLEQAKTNLRLAEVAAMKAAMAAKGVVGDPVALDRAEQEAAAALAAQRRIVAIVERKVAAAQKAKHEAWCETFRPLHDAGRQRRAAACIRADAAKAELDAADLDFQHGTAMIKQARDRGCKATDGVDRNALNSSVNSVADERAIWGSN